MSWITAIKFTFKRLLYSRVIWILVLNLILITIPVFGLLIIRTDDYRSINNRSLVLKELSRSIIVGLREELDLKFVEAAPVLAPYQRIMIVKRKNLQTVFDSRWVTSPPAEGFSYSFWLAQQIDEQFEHPSFPSLEEQNILNQMSQYIVPGVDNFSVIDNRYAYSINNFSYDISNHYSLVVIMDQSDLLRNRKIHRLLLFIISAFSISLGLIISMIYYRLLIQPMRILTKTVNSIRDKEENVESLFTGRNRIDETGQLSDAFFTTTRALIEERQSLKNFTNDVLTEIKPPLTIIRNTTELLLNETEEKVSNREIHSLVHNESERIENLLYDISRYSLIAKTSREKTQCSPADIIGSLKPLYTQNKIHWMIEHKGKVNLSEEHFISCLTNLLDNSLSFSPKNGFVTVRFFSIKKRILLTVSDTGPGVDDQEKEKIFDRFYSHRPEDSNHEHHSGLGLSIVKKILLSRNHQIDCLDNEPRGAVFQITFSK